MIRGQLNRLSDGKTMVFLVSSEDDAGYRERTFAAMLLAERFANGGSRADFQNDCAIVAYDGHTDLVRITVADNLAFALGASPVWTSEASEQRIAQLGFDYDEIEAPYCPTCGEQNFIEDRTAHETVTLKFDSVTGTFAPDVRSNYEVVSYDGLKCGHCGAELPIDILNDWR